MSGNRRGHRGRGGKGKCANPTYNQALALKEAETQQYFAWLMSLACSQFEWSGLPESVDTWYLERQLFQCGCATLCHERDMPDVLVGVQAGYDGNINIYGLPTSWHAFGANGYMFDCDSENGVLVWDRDSKVNVSTKLMLLARKLATYSRVENVNLIHQMTPWVVEAPEEQVSSVTSALAQAMTGQPAIVGYEGTSEMLTNGIKVFGETKVGWMGDKLQSGALGTMSEAFRILGIPHLQFEKSERLITNETRGTLSSTYLSMLDRLNGRKRALSWLHDNGWSDAQVRLAPWLADMFTSMMENEQDSSSSVFGSSGGE